MWHIKVTSEDMDSIDEQVTCDLGGDGINTDVKDDGVVLILIQE